MWVRLVALILLVGVLFVLPGCSTPPSEDPQAGDPQASPAPGAATSPGQPAATSPGQPSEPPAATTPEPAGPATPVITPSGPFDVTEVVLETSGGEHVTVAVHVAADPTTRALGLMHREHVPPGTGMLFLFPQDSSGGFWMKNTLVGLSIAFTAHDGRILRILDMDPCSADPCPVYDPETSYRMALEVPLGDFERLGVSEGDRLIAPGDLPAAR